MALILKSPHSPQCFPPVSPIIGEVGVPDPWISIVVDLDCVVDTVGGDAGGLITALGNACTSLRPPSPKLTYIYTSGTWVHGENRESIVTDTTPITRPAEIVSWRPAVEQVALANPTLNGIVIRPALLYGRGASLLAALFEAASKGGEIEWPGTPGVRYAVIHMDDLADLYLRVAESAPILGGRIFDAANDTTESEEDVLAKLVKISGAPGYRLKEPETGEC